MEQIANKAASTLNGAIDDSVTSLDVTSATTFPTEGNFRIIIDDEILLVTGVSGTTFTVTRGVEGTVAAAHADSAVVTHILTAESLTNVISERGGILEAIWEAMDSNTDPIDTLITKGNYRIFIYMGSHNAATWKPATNAVYTVPTGKKLLLLNFIVTQPINQDTSSRHARLYNVTDAVAVLETSTSAITPFLFFWLGDLAEDSKFMEIAAGKQVRAEIWSGDSNKRALGIVIITREVDE